MKPVSSRTMSGGDGDRTARFRSEMFVPVVLGSVNASQTQSNSSWETMHDRLDQRRKQWNDEVVLSLYIAYQ